MQYDVAIIAPTKALPRNLGIGLKFAVLGAACLIGPLSIPSNAQSNGKNSKSSSPVQIPYTGTFGLPNVSSADTENPFGIETLTPPTPRFLPSSVTQKQSSQSIPTLPDLKADHVFADYQRGFYKAAFHGATIRVARNPHDGAAMTLLGELYAQGLGVERDINKAEEWYQQGAQQNDPNALFALAMIKLGQSSAAANDEKTKKHAEAVALLEKASAANHPLATYNLSISLLGSRRNPDLVRAVELLRKAAEQEVPDAQYALAVMLREGQGAPKNSTQAGQWMARAATNGNLSAQVEFAIMMFNGNGMEADEPRAARLFAIAASRGNAIAQNRLARILVAGRGMPKDLVKAASWHILASRQGRSDQWLDTALKPLTTEERKQAEEIANQRTEELNAGIEP